MGKGVPWVWYSRRPQNHFLPLPPGRAEMDHRTLHSVFPHIHWEKPERCRSKWFHIKCERNCSDKGMPRYILFGMENFWIGSSSRVHTKFYSPLHTLLYSGKRAYDAVVNTTWALRPILVLMFHNVVVKIPLSLTCSKATFWENFLFDFLYTIYNMFNITFYMIT